MKVIQKAMLLFLCCVFTLQAETNFSDFVKGKTHNQGYFSFYHDDEKGKVYLELNEFNQSFLFQSSLPHGIGSNDIGLDRGQLGDTRLVQFERVGNKVFLRQLNTYYRADTSNKLEKQAIDEAFASSIIWGFTVAAKSKDNNKYLIDYTPFLLSDIHNLASQLKEAKQGTYKVDATRSGIYSKRTKAFPDNTEFEATVTFKGKGAGDYLRSVTPDSSAVTVNLHHSLIKLPNDEYQTRGFNPNSGYWSVEYADYASAIDETLIKRQIPRHRLNKINPAAPVSEAIAPIIYYLDAGVPEPVRSALIDGALWWDQAFSAIGYKNAFQVKMLPEDADPMDVRYNVIQWVHRATRGWSYGASVIDPRTGEIIKGHVTLGSLRVRQDYLIALGLTSPFKTETTDTSKMKEMALARIRQLSAHEVGHTLGIAHNFAASMNDRASVMDYPHPKIKLKNNNIDLSDAYAKDIGDWDKYVIAYGYSDFGKALTPKQETEKLQALIKIMEKQNLDYLSDPDARPSSGGHATAHLWDNGDNAIKELSQVLKVREKALADFGLNSIPFGTPLSEIEQTLVPIYNFHRYQVEAVVKLIAGVNYRYEVRDDNAIDGISSVSADMQQQALAAIIHTLDTQVLALPEALLRLIPPKAYGYSRNRESFTSRTGITFDAVSAAEASAKFSIGLLLKPERLARSQQQAALDKKIPDVSKILATLRKGTIEKTTSTGLALLIQQRVNQQVVDHLLSLWHQQNVVSEVRAEVHASLKQLTQWLEKNDNTRKYKALSKQFSMLKSQINFSLNEGKQSTVPFKTKMAPGSPIGG
jgi:hypothetical protein